MVLVKPEKVFIFGQKLIENINDINRLYDEAGLESKNQDNRIKIFTKNVNEKLDLTPLKEHMGIDDDTNITHVSKYQLKEIETWRTSFLHKLSLDPPEFEYRDKYELWRAKLLLLILLKYPTQTALKEEVSKLTHEIDNYTGDDDEVDLKQFKNYYGTTLQPEYTRWYTTEKNPYEENQLYRPSTLKF